MKTGPAILILCLAIVAGGAVARVAWQSHEARQLTAAHTELLGKLEESHQTVTALTAEKAGLSEKLAALETREEELRDRVESLEAAAKMAIDTVPRPYRARAFLGQENIGEAWIVPHNLARDPASGRYRFEPVLVIDESARGHFTVHHTNVVEREVHTTQVYQERYGYPAYYYIATGRPGRPGRPPGKPDGPVEQPERPEPRVAPQQPDARTRLFAPPTTGVNSRSQVFAPPTVSPTSRRVFAP